jgi:hypothetical protein
MDTFFAFVRKAIEFLGRQSTRIRELEAELNQLYLDYEAVNAELFYARAVGPEAVAAAQRDAAQARAVADEARAAAAEATQRADALTAAEVAEDATEAELAAALAQVLAEVPPLGDFIPEG